MSERVKATYYVIMRDGVILDCIEDMWLEEMRNLGQWMAENPQGWLAFRTVNGYCMVPARDIASFRLPEID